MLPDPGFLRLAVLKDGASGLECRREDGGVNISLLQITANSTVSSTIARSAGV